MNLELLLKTLSYNERIYRNKTNEMNPEWPRM